MCLKKTTLQISDNKANVLCKDYFRFYFYRQHSSEILIGISQYGKISIDNLLVSADKKIGFIGDMEKGISSD